MTTVQLFGRQFNFIPTISFPNLPDLPIIQGVDDPLPTPYDLEMRNVEFIARSEIFAVMIQIYRC